LDNQSLLIRIVAAGLPLVVIALVFGAIGYATTKTETASIPPLAAADPDVPAAQGEIASISANQITLVTETGAQLDYALAPDATVEVLEPTNLAAIQLGDWLNGGAIPHADTLLALVRLILLPDPVTP
jgi:hypothetical protein